MKISYAKNKNCQYLVQDEQKLNSVTSYCLKHWIVQLKM